ncbi:MAG: energy-coupling factor transporter ATPase [Clostridia bacterium]|nr:energy-coupling factor transporter ATPase [Clostridia bacterium]
MRIVAEHLSYTYNPNTPFAAAALKDVSLCIEEGEFFGIIGHTGSGKSTFIQHLNGLIRLPSSMKKYRERKPKRGEQLLPRPTLRVGSYDLSEKTTDFRALRKSVGMVFQYPEHQLFGETVKEDVAFGLKNFAEKGKELSKEVETSAVREAIEAVGLNYGEVAEKSPFDLSGGQKRRVAIAGVIVSRPEILVLDEPAAGLDPLGKKEIMELLHRLHKTWCKTVIIVSHDMDEIAENCTMSALFAEGTVKYCLSPRELFQKAEELFALGLDIPLVAKLCRALDERGIHIDCDYTAADFVKKILALKRGEGRA